MPMEITIKTHPPKIDDIQKLVRATKNFPYLTFDGYSDRKTKRRLCHPEFISGSCSIDAETSSA